MTNEESAQLIRDPIFIGRVKVSCLKYADSVLAQSGTHPGGNAAQRWALQTFQQPDQAALMVVGATVIDGAVQSAGKDVTDNDLQRAVEVQINKML